MHEFTSLTVMGYKVGEWELGHCGQRVCVRDVRQPSAGNHEREAWELVDELSPDPHTFLLGNPSFLGPSIHLSWLQILMFWLDQPHCAPGTTLCLETEAVLAERVGAEIESLLCSSCTDPGGQ